MVLGRAAAAAVLVVVAAACGNAASTVGTPARERSSCERALVTYHDGSRPVRRETLRPPPPHVRAVAVTKRTTRLEWSIPELPADCEVVALKLTVDSEQDPGATPTPAEVRTRGRSSGAVEITYPEFLQLPDVASASAYSRSGRRSRVAKVAIQRRAGLPDDPPEPPRPVTAPAGAPADCRGHATVVGDPPGDVLGYAPGSPPEVASPQTPTLGRLDLRRAAVQVDGQLVCASFDLAVAPGKRDFRLTLVLGDLSSATPCCATLAFEQTAGRLQVGTLVGTTERRLAPVAQAGASLRGTTLVVTGRSATPPTGRLGWSVTTRWAPSRYCPCYGDWLPAYSAVGEPAVRHADGVVVPRG